MIFIIKLLLWMLYGIFGYVFIKDAIREFKTETHFDLGVYIIYTIVLAAGIASLVLM